MEHFTIAIIGGGASGLFLAGMLSAKNTNKKIALFERNDRVGKKLSATGNGQGNLTNLAVAKTDYFSVSSDKARAETLIRAYDNRHFCAFLENLGVLPVADERGRVYPAGRQASAVTDALRFFVADKISTFLSMQITKMQKVGGRYELTAKTSEGNTIFSAENVVLCTGGKASKNFGSDGNGYALAEGFLHTITPLYPSLVQIKTDVAYTKTLKGIRVNDGKLTVESGKKKTEIRGDIIFTEYGVSGDAVFRASAFFTDKIDKGVRLHIDFLPEISAQKVTEMLTKKKKQFPSLANVELLGGILNNQVGRAVLKRANGDINRAVELVKDFPLEVKGSLGFDYAQVTKGGIPLEEVDENLQSKKSQGLYFMGEILDVDGECGGFNLQWAYTSACVVANALQHEEE